MDEWVYAFKDIDPQAPVHIVLIPKEHCANIMELKDMKLMTYLLAAIQKSANKNLSRRVDLL